MFVSFPSSVSRLAPGLQNFDDFLQVYVTNDENGDENGDETWRLCGDENGDETETRTEMKLGDCVEKMN